MTPRIQLDDELYRRYFIQEECGALPMANCPINITNDLTPGGQLRRMYDENTDKEYRVLLVEYDPLKCSHCGLGPRCCSSDRANDPHRCCRYRLASQGDGTTAWDISANLAQTQEHLVGLEQSAHEWKAKYEALEKEREETAQKIARYRFKVRDLLDELSRASGLGIKKSIYEDLGLLTPEEMGVSPEYAYTHSMDIFNNLGSHTKIERDALEKIKQETCVTDASKSPKVCRSKKGKKESNKDLLKIAVEAAKKTIGFELTPLDNNLPKNAWSTEAKSKDYTVDEDDE